VEVNGLVFMMISGAGVQYSAFSIRESIGHRNGDGLHERELEQRARRDGDGLAAHQRASDGGYFAEPTFCVWLVLTVWQPVANARRAAAMTGMMHLMRCFPLSLLSWLVCFSFRRAGLRPAGPQAILRRQ
jgi:hypothetical protein